MMWKTKKEEGKKKESCDVYRTSLRFLYQPVFFKLKKLNDQRLAVKISISGKTVSNPM